MGSIFGGGSSSQTTTNEPWKPAQDILKNLLANAEQLFDKQGGINAEFLEKEIANLTPEMQESIKNLVNTDKFQGWAQMGQDAIQQGMGGIGQGQGILGGLSGQGITSDDLNSMAKDLYNNELVQTSKEQLGEDLKGGLSKSIQSLNQQASGSGNMGSSRAGVAEGVAIGDAAEAYSKGAAAIESNAMNQAYGQAMGTLQGNQQTALGAGGQLGQLGLGSVGQLGNLSGIYQQGLNNALTGSGLLQQYQQGVLDNKWFNATGQQNAGWNNLNNLLGVAGSIGGMGGSSTQTGKNPSNLGGLLQGAGQIVGGGAQAGWWSDSRLKDKLEIVCEAHTRYDEEGMAYPVPNLYKWEWNDKALSLFIEHGFTVVPPTFGCIAQELETTGFEKFVESMDTGVEGLDGSVKYVNYLALCLYVGFEGEVGAE